MERQQRGRAGEKGIDKRGGRKEEEKEGTRPKREGGY